MRRCAHACTGTYLWWSRGGPLLEILFASAASPSGWARPLRTPSGVPACLLTTRDETSKDLQVKAANIGAIKSHGPTLTPGLADSYLSASQKRTFSCLWLH